MSVYKNQKIRRAEKLVAPRCEAAVARYLDFCQAHPGRPVTWQSAEHPWSFRVTFVGSKWVMDDLEAETEGMEGIFEGEDLASREGVDHVICSVLVPLAIEVALGEVPGVTTEEFLSDMETAEPSLDGEAHTGQ